MKKKIFTALGLMSGTSMDGVDISIIKSDGYDEFFPIFNTYFEYENDLYQELAQLRDKILIFDDLSKYSKELINLEKKYTIFNSKIINEVLNKNSEKIDLIGFHGQTVFHSPFNKISKQLGDGKLLSQLNKKIVINNFREKDIKNGGQGAPLTPIFHKLIFKIIKNKYKLNYPMIFVNIGGITNVTQVIDKGDDFESSLFAYDIAPGNCLLDEWVRKNTKKKFDKDGEFAKRGVVNDLIYNQAVENFKITSYRNSMDVKDFDLSFIRGLSLEDGCATLTKFTAYLISEGIKTIDIENKIISKNYFISGGGRKNNILINDINNFLIEKDIKLKDIDNYDLDGDFIESQAFGYLAIRSFLNLPISFPNTTRCKQAVSGGTIEKNF